MTKFTRSLPAALLACCLLCVPGVAFAEGEVDVNTAPADVLERLPGLGPTTAARIVAYREANGPFQRLSDLAKVEGIASGTLEKLKEVLSFPDAPTADAPKLAKALVSDEVITRGVGAEAKKLLERYENEPTIREVQEAAGRFAEVHPERMRSWRTRSRLAALAPGFRAEYRYVNEFDQRLKTGGDAADTQQDDFGTQHRPLARVDWELDRLVFNPDELRVSNEIVDLVRLRESVLDQVTKIYYERRRLQVDLDLTPPKDIAGRVRKELRLQELVADLDSLTGGYFSKKLIESGQDPY